MNNFDPTNLSDDICELLDLYVIGALDDNEESQVKNILSVSSNAKTYVDEQREVLANLEMDSPSNPALFDSIKNEISKKNEIHNTNNVVSLSTQKLINKSWYNKISYMAVAASVLAVVIYASILFTSVNSNTKNEASKTLNREQELALFASQKTTKQMTLEGTSGDIKVVMMMNDKGEVMLDGRSMDSLSKSETYQLWAIVSDATSPDGIKVISASVLGNNPDISMTHIDGKIKGFAITKEVSGGVPKSSNDPMYLHMLA